MNRLGIALCALFAFSCASTNLENGTIFTAQHVVAGADQSPRQGYAIYTSGGTIREVGPAADIRRAHPSARIIDAGDATILPGLVDAHAHLYGLGLAVDTLRLVDTTSFEQIVGLVAQRAAGARSGEWVLGRGWDQNDWPDKAFPTSAALDRAVPNHPVWLRRIDGHAGIANAAAMRAAGVTGATTDPPGGKIERDAAGNPTGVFIDAAMDLIDKAVPAPTFAQVKDRVRAAAELIAKEGLTAIHDAGADDETLRAVRELIDEKRFPIRLYGMLGDEEALLRDWFARGPQIGYGDRLTVRSVKVYADGALGSRGAAMLEPYSDDPGNRGLVIATPEHITDVSRRALAAGFQVNTHAIGDRGVRNVIDSYEAAGVTGDRRFRIEHLQVIAPADLPRLARSGIIASMQPTHATSDAPWAEARLGAQRVRGAYAWRSVLESGARLALGSDFPVEEVNPWLGVEAAVVRANWYPEEKLTLAEAIRGFTLDAAYAAFEEESRGTIEPGKLADLTIVHGNPYAIAPESLGDVRVKMTVVGGEVVHQ